MSTSKSEHYMLLKMIPILKKRYEEATKDAGVMWSKDSNRYLLGLPLILKRGRKSEEEKAERQTNNYLKFYRMKNSIKKALVEMELFLQVSPKKEIDAVFHKETIRPFIHAMIETRRLEIPDPNDPTKKRTTHISEGTSDVQKELIGMLARATLIQFKSIEPNLSSPNRKALDDAESVISSLTESNYRSPLRENTHPNI